MYNFTKTTCDTCGKKEVKDRNWRQHPDQCFRLGNNGSVLCGACHREKELADLFRLMDARDEYRSRSATNKAKRP